MDELEGTQPATSSPANSDVAASRSSAAEETHHDATGGDSSPAGEKQPTSLREALARVQPEVAEETAAGDGEGQAAGSPPTDQAESGQATADGATGGKDETPGAKAGADGSLNVPFAQRPEWKGLVALVGDERRGEAIKLMRPVFEANHNLNRQVEALKPAASIVSELRQLTGDEAGFQKMQGIVRTYAQEPEQAIPILESMLQDARQRAGVEITSPDLKQRLAEIDDKVTRGVLDADEAANWKADLTAAEKARASGRQLQQREQQAAAQQQVQAQQSQLGQINAWEENIRSRDPDFGSVTDLDDPNHGRSIADRVFDGLIFKQTMKPNATTAELLKEADRIYKLERTRNPGRLRQQRVITSEQSSTTARPAPKTMKEALNQVPRERG